MVNIVSRMTKLRALLNIRLGPGAAILPPEVTRIHMDFAFKMNDGHFGPRKFWRNCLPRLKYHNPAIPMTVNRNHDQTGPALMTIHFTDPSSASELSAPISSTTQPSTSTAPTTPSSSGSPTTHTKEINMKHRTDSEILSQLISLTNAKLVRATPEEQRQLKELAEHKARAEKDSALSAVLNERRRKEQAILTQARGEVASSNEA
ncbi:50S ribosomal Mrp49 protein [Rutstroemia sp. NJR-2017a WRK4]|nr:50S ribosomal Mrp49 protein [Rutstroemia sp. NJR-2017a WRK4]